MNDEIKQERLSNVIKSYLDYSIGDKIEQANGTSNKVKYWVGKNRLRCFWNNIDSNVFIIDKKLFYNVEDMFSISNDDYDFLKYVFIDWFNSAQDLIKIKNIESYHIRFERLNENI